MWLEILPMGSSAAFTQRSRILLGLFAWLFVSIKSTAWMLFGSIKIPSICKSERTLFKISWLVRNPPCVST